MPTCSRCGQTIAPGDAYCPNCGSQIAASKRPRLSLSPLLGIFLIISGLLLFPVTWYVIFLWGTSGQPESAYVKNLWDISFDLRYKIIPMLLTSGVALLVLAGLKNRPIAFASIFTFGIWGYALSDLLLIATKEPSITLINIFSFSYVCAGLAITSMLSYPLARNEWRLTNKQMRTETAAYLILGSLILAPIMWFILSIPLGVLMGAVMIIIGLAAWIIWHLLGDWVTVNTLLTSYTKRGLRHEKYILVKMRSEPFRIPEIDAYELLRMAMLPFLFSYAVASLHGPFTFGEGLWKWALTTIITLYLLPTLALFVAPPKWLFDALNIKRLDKHKGTLESPKVLSYLEEFVGIGALFAFIGVSYEATEAGNIGGAISNSYFTLWLLLPSILIATILYVKFSLRRHFQKVLKQIDYVEIDSIRDLGTLI